jgi:RNA polymerase sigma factor (sigma-70 family)
MQDPDDQEQRPDPAPGPASEDEGKTERLVRRAQDGDEEALNELFAAHYDELRHFVRKRLGPAMRRQVDDSQDILHSAMRGALLSLPQFEPRGDEAWVRWMGTIIVNKISSKVRHHRAVKRGGGKADVGGTEGLGWIGRAEAEGSSPSSAAVAREEQDRLYDALETLPDARRELLVKSHISKVPVDEIAVELGISEEAVRQRLLRAEKALKVAIKKLQQDPE